MSNKFHHYAQQGTGKLPDLQRNSRIHDPALYLPDPGLVNAVNVAVNMDQPLLLTGEPGTGKTQLAFHVANFFGLPAPLVFNAQTTSTARDLFYRYDALGHFQHSQTSKVQLDNDAIEQRFIRYQALGRAIRDRQRYVVLIDEIDKAPRDLPNDVLYALEHLTFDVPEADRSFTANPAERPLVIMTSNSEKNLPEPFLRRVAFYHIEFPDAPRLLEILQGKTDGYTKEQLQPLVALFEQVRGNRKLKLKKKPATAELIQWTDLLHRLEFDPASLTGELAAEAREKLAVSWSLLAKNKEDLDLLRKLDVASLSL